MTRFLTIAGLAIALSACAADRPMRRFEYTRVCMGVQTRIALYGNNESKAFEAAAEAFSAGIDLRPDAIAGIKCNLVRRHHQSLGSSRENPDGQAGKYNPQPVAGA